MDRYEKIRKALAMEPTPGPFSTVRSYSQGNQELIIRLTCNDEYGITENYCTVHNRLGDAWKTEANATYIAACDPDTIRTLLDERDALAKDAARYRCLSAMATQQADYLGPIFRIDVRRSEPYLFNFDAAVDAAIAAREGVRSE